MFVMTKKHALLIINSRTGARKEETYQTDPLQSSLSSVKASAKKSNILYTLGILRIPPTLLYAFTRIHCFSVVLTFSFCQMIEIILK